MRLTALADAVGPPLPTRGARARGGDRERRGAIAIGGTADAGIARAAAVADRVKTAIPAG